MVLSDGLGTTVTLMFWEVGVEVILEEVPGVGSLEGDHTKLVGRGSSITQELKSDRWVSCLGYTVDKEVGLRHSDEDLIGALKDTSVAVVTVGDELSLSDNTLLMDELVSVTWHLIGLHVAKGLAWVLDEEVLEGVELLADDGVDLSDGVPKLSHLIGGRESLVSHSTESFSVPVVFSSWDASCCLFFDNGLFLDDSLFLDGLIGDRLLFRLGDLFGDRLLFRLGDFFSFLILSWLLALFTLFSLFWLLLHFFLSGLFLLLLLWLLLLGWLLLLLLAGSRVLLAGR